MGTESDAGDDTRTPTCGPRCVPEPQTELGQSAEEQPPRSTSSRRVSAILTCPPTIARMTFAQECAETSCHRYLIARWVVSSGFLSRGPCSRKWRGWMGIE